MLLDNFLKLTFFITADQHSNPTTFRNYVHTFGEFYSRYSSAKSLFNVFTEPFVAVLNMLLDNLSLADIIVFTKQVLKVVYLFCIFHFVEVYNKKLSVTTYILQFHL